MKFMTHLIWRIIRSILMVSLILLLVVFVWLKVGIKADSLTLSEYHVSGLYIKLDKKLTLMSQKMVVPHRKTAPSFTNIDKVFDKIKYLFTFFDYIELNNIQFKNNKLNIIFADDVLFVTSDAYEIAGNIHRKEEILQADISMLHLRKDNVNMTGKLTYNLKTDSLKTQGEFDAYSIKGRFNASKQEDTINLGLASDTFTDLHPLISVFDLNPAVKSWVLDKVRAQSYQLQELNATLNVADKQIKLDTNTLKATALFNQPAIHFKEDVSPVLASSFVLRYEKDGLFFDFDTPTYMSKSLEGSKVAIHPLSEANTTLMLDLRLDTPFDATMGKLLESYGIRVPVLQESAKSDIAFHAAIGLKKEHQEYLVDVNLSKGDVWLDRVKLPVEKGRLHYEKGVVYLKDIGLKDTMYDVLLQGQITLAQQKADLQIHANTIQLKNKDEVFFTVKNETFPVQIAYKDQLSIALPTFGLKIVDSRQDVKCAVSDLTKVSRYLSNPVPFSEGGDMEMTTKDFKTYMFKGLLKRSSCILYEKQDECQVRVPYRATLTPKDFDFYAFDGRVHYSHAKSRLRLENINIDLEKFLVLQQKEPSQKSSKEGNAFIILGKNSNLRYAEHTLLTDSYDVEVLKNGNIKAIGSSDGDIVKFSKTGDTILMQALRIKDKVLHALINFEGLYEGRYSFKAEGKPKVMMKGEIIVEGGVMKDFRAYNNTLALINTLPDLAMLRNPGFSQKGFSIQEGVVVYRVLEGTKVFFDSIYIKGDTTTIVGKGSLDLEKNTIKIDLALQLAQNLTKLISNLPLVGYIVTGKDKGVTIGLKITGSLDKPVVQTSAAKEILTLPLQILKRTLESPAKMIQK